MINTQIIKMLSLLMCVTFFTSCDNNTDDENTTTSLWTKRANIPNADLRFNAKVITYNNEAYLLAGKGGSRFSSRPEILKYSNNSWTRIVTFDGFAIAGGSLAIKNNDVIYIMGGVNISNAPTNEIKAFSISDNTFSDETRFSKPSNATYTDTKAYFANNQEFSSFDFETNSTELLPLIPNNEPLASARFTTENNTIYVLFEGIESNNFFAFNEVSKQWVQLANFPGGTRSGASIVSTTTDVYAGLGRKDESPFFDIWKYNIETNTWDMFAEYPGEHFSSGFSFEIDNELYFGGGFTGGGVISNDVLNEEVFSIRVK